MVARDRSHMCAWAEMQATFLLEEGAPHRGERLRSLFFKYVKVNLGHGSSQIPEAVPPPTAFFSLRTSPGC